MNNKKLKSIANARRLLRKAELGVLSTHSKANEGYPFGSVSSYLSTVQGDAIFYISDLAQHTKNLDNNPKMCLTVFLDSESRTNGAVDDPNAGARLSLLGHASVLSPEQGAEVAERYFTLYPDSRKYQGSHDFKFYKLRCERVRFIGGFGDIHWISAQEWRLQTPDWLDSEGSMIEHMNEDHMDAMQLICAHHFGLHAARVEMLLLNPDGCFISADASKPLYVPFESIAGSSLEVRQQLIKLTNGARAAANLHVSKGAIEEHRAHVR